MVEHLPRKLAVILYADVAGYSRLTGEDEEGTHRTLSEYLDLISASIRDHSGAVVHYAGDAILADFGTVTEALICATAVQENLRERNKDLPEEQKLQFRIGVNLGEVIVDRSDIYGEGVNVAARLEGLAEPGGICISGTVYDAISTKLPLTYKFMGEQKVKNIAKPVRAYRVLTGAAIDRPTEHRTWSSRKKFQGAVAVAAIAAVAIGGVIVWKRIGSDGRQPAAVESPRRVDATVPVADEPSIAVLPFTNKSEAADQGFFADGMSDDIIVELTKVPGLLVIARDSTFNYRSESPDVRELGKMLNAHYVLQGSVRRSQDDIRINATLIDATSGQHIWGDRYDAKLADVFALQDEITEKIVAALSLKLSSIDRENLTRRETSDVLAYELFLRGRDQFLRFSRADTFKAREYFEKARARDPDFARVYAMLAWTYAFEYTNGWSDTPEQTIDRALELAEKAIELDDRVPVAYFVKGLVYREQREYVKALVEAEKAIEIDSNYAIGYVLLATVLYYAGRPEEGLAMVEKAERVNPIHPSNYPFHKGQALFILKRYSEAIESFEKGLEQNPTSQRIRVWLAVSYAQAGRMDDAKWEAVEILASDPDFRLSRLAHAFPFKDPTDREHFNVALRKVGFEERW